MNARSAHPDVVERLRQHRLLARVPEAELAWLAARASLRRFEVGAFVTRKGDDVRARLGFLVVLTGRIAHYADRGGRRRKVIEWGPATSRASSPTRA